MATTEKSVLPSYVLLDRIVRMDHEAVQEESDWAIMECTEWKAYGCDDDDSRIKRAFRRMKGLALLARLAEPPNLSELSVRLAAMPKPKPPTSFPPGTAVLPIFDPPDAPDDLPTYVEAAGDDLVVLTSRFEAGSSYYLAYDAIGKSLSMIPFLPDSWRTYCSMRPLPLRAGAGAAGYSLALLAKDWDFDMETEKEVYRDVLALCPPRPSCTIPPGSYEARTPWQLKSALLPPETPDRFHGDMVFSSGGQAFWADLAQGALFCRCDDALSGLHDVQFRYIQLPPEFHLRITFSLRGDLELCRTMSCIGDDSIRWFVCISGGSCSAHPGDHVMTMWTLTLATGQWRKDAELLVSSLWEMEGFKKAGLATGA